jgi:hypothetical protein
VESVGYKADVPARAKEKVSQRMDSVKSKVSDTATPGQGGRGRHCVSGW